MSKIIIGISTANYRRQTTVIRHLKNFYSFHIIDPYFISNINDYNINRICIPNITTLREMKYIGLYQGNMIYIEPTLTLNKQGDNDFIIWKCDNAIEKIDNMMKSLQPFLL